jgi:PAS domain S-box-containing protein
VSAARDDLPARSLPDASAPRHRAEPSNEVGALGEVLRGDWGASQRGHDADDRQVGSLAPPVVNTRADLLAQQLDAVDASIIATDVDGVVVSWNAPAERLHGWTAAEAIGRPLWEVTVPRRLQAASRAGFSAVLRLGAWEGEVEGHRRDGTTFPAHVANRTLRDPDGEPCGVVAVAFDHTEQMAKEQALARNNAWLRAITDRMGDGLCTLDADGSIAYVNPIGEHLMGAPAARSLGECFFDQLRPIADAEGPGDVETGRCQPPGDLASDGGRRAAAVLLRRADGTDVPIEYVATSLPPAQDGQANGWVVTFRDISRRLARQQKLHADARHGRWMARIQDALDHDRFVLYS